MVLLPVLPCTPPPRPDFTLRSHQARMFFEGVLALGSTTVSWGGKGAAAGASHNPHRPWARTLNGPCLLVPRITSCVHTQPGGSAASWLQEHSLGHYCGDGGCRGLVFKVFAQEDINLTCNVNSLTCWHLFSKSFHYLSTVSLHSQLTLLAGQTVPALR